jgi:hypothetical protein
MRGRIPLSPLFNSTPTSAECEAGYLCLLSLTPPPHSAECEAGYLCLLSLTLPPHLQSARQDTSVEEARRVRSSRSARLVATALEVNSLLVIEAHNLIAIVICIEFQTFNVHLIFRKKYSY